MISSLRYFCNFTNMLQIHLHNTRLLPVMSRSFLPYSFTGGLGTCRRHHQTSCLNPGRLVSRHYICRFLGNQSLQSLSTGQLGLLQHYSTTNRDMAVCSGVQPDLPPPPSDPSPSSWKVWILGMLLTVILPFLGNKLGPFLKLKEEVETVVETSEHVTEMVENVAEAVEKVADEIGDQLAEGGKLKKIADFVENAAREAAKDAHLVEDVIEKVEEVEKEVDSFMEPATKEADSDEITKEATDQS